MESRNLTFVFLALIYFFGLISFTQQTAAPTILTCESGVDSFTNVVDDVTLLRVGGGEKTNCVYEITKPDALTCGIALKFENLNCTSKELLLTGTTYKFGFPICSVNTKFRSFPFASSSNRMTIAASISSNSYNLSLKFLRDCGETQTIHPDVIPVFTCDREHNVVNIPAISTDTYSVLLASSLEAPTCKFVFPKPANYSCGTLDTNWDQKILNGKDESGQCSESSSVTIGGETYRSNNERLCGSDLEWPAYRYQLSYNAMNELSITTRTHPLNSFVLSARVMAPTGKCHPPSDEIVTCQDGIQSIRVTGNATLGSSPLSPECTFRIEPIQGSTQIRIDFIEQNLERPNYDYNFPYCQDAYITIENSATVRNFLLCGEVMPMHSLYVTFPRQWSDYKQPITLKTKIAPGNNFKFTITYIPNDSYERAPDDCLVALDGTSGVLRTIGYPQYMLNHNYKACYTGTNQELVWEECDKETIGSDASPFDLSRYATSIDGSSKLAIEGRDCKYFSSIHIDDDVERCGATFPYVITYVGNAFLSGKSFDISIKLASDYKPDRYTRVVLHSYSYTTPSSCPNETIGFEKCLQPTLGGEVMNRYCACKGKSNPAEPVQSKITGFCLKYTKSH
jgi:hypothetical protein